eukprot:2340758-Amphidinium_carterae.1
MIGKPPAAAPAGIVGAPRHPHLKLVPLLDPGCLLATSGTYVHHRHQAQPNQLPQYPPIRLQHDTNIDTHCGLPVPLELGLTM